MNGRVYDPLVARFLSADPYIQDPEHSQSYNRYSYVWNNPTNFTDPSGFKTLSPCGQRSSCAGTTEDGGELQCQKGGKAADCHDIGVARGSDARPNNGADHSGVAQPSAAPKKVIRSPEVLRALVPGQVQWDDARTDYVNGNYGGATLHTGLMFAEQIMTAVSFGYYQGSRATVQTALVAEEKILAQQAAEKSGEALAKGFKGITVQEIIEINRGLGNTGNSYRAVETVIANAERYEGFMAKGGSMIRNIAGGHLFENGNKRTAVELFERLIRRNGVDGPPTSLIWKVVDRVATGDLKTVPEIAKALRGF